MFAAFKKKNPYVQPSKSLYAACLEATREPMFYADLGVPDSMDGRFDLLLLHVFMIVDRTENQTLSQAMFDVMFADMDQMLREIGIGDVGVPKHMRRMMKGFNGRMHGYATAFESAEQGAITAALERNVYGTIDAPDPAQVKKLAAYVDNARECLKSQNMDDILSGTITFTN